MIKVCMYQEFCIHYTNGTKRKVHHIRISEPCNLWMKYSCKVMGELLIIQEYTTGKPDVCPVSTGEKRKKVMKK